MALAKRTQGNVNDLLDTLCNTVPCRTQQIESILTLVGEVCEFIMFIKAGYVVYIESNYLHYITKMSELDILLCLCMFEVWLHFTHFPLFNADFKQDLY